jgi:PTS system mannose-specific IIC component/fructoselysine and glucoselysine-specific PTS system IIC component
MSISTAIICALVFFVIRMVDPYMLSWQCLNRPIVVGPLIGLLLGDFHTGIVMGASLEAIFMGISAIGGSVPSDCLSGTIIAVAYAILVGGDGAVETGLALSLSIGTVMSSFSSMFTPVWAALAPYWEKLAAECNPRKFKIQALLVNALTCVPSSLVIFLGVAFGIDSLSAGLAACPAWVLTGLSAAGSMMTAVGFGILLSMIWSADICVFYFVGFICSKSLGLSSLGIAVIGAAIALTLFFLEKNIVDAKKSVGSSDNVAVAAGPANSEEDFF